MTCQNSKDTSTKWRSAWCSLVIHVPECTQLDVTPDQPTRNASLYVYKEQVNKQYMSTVFMHNQYIYIFTMWKIYSTITIETTHPPSQKQFWMSLQAAVNGKSFGHLSRICGINAADILPKRHLSSAQGTTSNLAIQYWMDDRPVGVSLHQKWTNVLLLGGYLVNIKGFLALTRKWEHDTMNSAKQHVP